MRYRHNGHQPVYVPNSYGGPQADPQRHGEPKDWFVSGEIMRSAYVPHAEDDDFIQARNLYRYAMSRTDRDHLVSNIVGHLSQGVERFIQERAIKDYWSLIEPELGARVAKGLGLESVSELSPLGGENSR